MQITKHDFFDPIIPYITEMDSKNQTISVDVPRDIILNSSEMDMYFKNWDKRVVSVKAMSDEYFILFSTLSGIIKDKQVFDYVLARFEKEASDKNFGHKLSFTP